MPTPHQGAHPRVSTFAAAPGARRPSASPRRCAHRSILRWCQRYLLRSPSQIEFLRAAGIVIELCFAAWAGMTENRHNRRMNLRLQNHESPRRSRPNPLLLAIALLALALQLFVVQTHIHTGTDSGPLATPVQTVAGVEFADVADKPVNPDPIPVKDDSSSCPICQAFAHSGPLLAVIQILAWILFFTIASRSQERDHPVRPDLHVSHSWFGRAPPSESAHV